MMVILKILVLHMKILNRNKRKMLLLITRKMQRMMMKYGYQGGNENEEKKHLKSNGGSKIYVTHIGILQHRNGQIV